MGKWYRKIPKCVLRLFDERMIYVCVCYFCNVFFSPPPPGLSAATYITLIITPNLFISTFQANFRMCRWKILCCTFALFNWGNAHKRILQTLKSDRNIHYYFHFLIEKIQYKNASDKSGLESWLCPWHICIAYACTHAFTHTHTCEQLVTHMYTRTQTFPLMHQFGARRLGLSPTSTT